MTHSCLLCDTQSTFFYNFKDRIYYICPNCKGIFLEPGQRMETENEEKHYRFHNNDVEDPGYLNFVSPITQAVLNDFTSEHSGLDFGAGTGSAISKVLSDNQYKIKQFDPFFHNYPELLTKQYDYIVSCEVVEHFYNPNKEFKLLKKMLLPNGKLYIMTHLYSPEIDFKTWYYKNDHTHVFLYQKETMEWIAQKYGFKELTIEKRLIFFGN